MTKTADPLKEDVAPVKPPKTAPPKEDASKANSLASQPLPFLSNLIGFDENRGNGKNSPISAY